MEALSFLKFWRPVQKDVQNLHSYIEEEEDDSFFELEFPLYQDGVLVEDNNCGRRETKRFGLDDDDKVEKCDKFQSPSLLLSPADHSSKKKIIPIDPTSSKPQSQSPIAIFKSAPKFRAFSFRIKSMETSDKPENMGKKLHRTELGDYLTETPRREKHGSKHFSVKFGSEDGPFFVRVSSSKKTEHKSSEEETHSDDSSNKLHKYLKLIKPLYVKRANVKTKFAGDFTSSSSPGSSPATVLPVKKEKQQGNLQAGIRVACKHLGKSRSVTVASPASRRDDSLVLHNDGIQSAILHCKRSFNSPRESSVLWRSSGDFCHEKLSNASSTDSSVLTRLSSVSSASEKTLDSAWASTEEGIFFSL